MIELPKRFSLVAQVALKIRQAIKQGEWIHSLPGTRVLADQLQVSPTTLLKAINQLKREGWIEISARRRPRIRPHFRGRGGAMASNIVGALVSQPVYAMQPTMIFRLTELQRHLQDASLQMKFHWDARLLGAHPSKRLENLVKETRAACWILCSVNSAVQEWFMKRGIPALVHGFVHQGLRLPSIDVDHEAACRHAAGKFLSFGHRRVVLLIHRSGMAGDLASERGFLSGFPPSRGDESLASVLRHDGTVDGVRKKLDSLFQEEKSYTGILVSDTFDVLTVVTHLCKVGLHIPRDVSVISRDPDFFLTRVLPSVACYDFDFYRYSVRLSRLVVDLARTGYLPCRSTRIMPQFHGGNSLGPPPS